MNRHLLHTTPRRARRLAPILLAALPILGACGDDAPGPTAEASEEPADESTAEPVAEAPATENVLSVVMEDFHYGELPAEVPAGTRIEVSNVSDAEIHEFVAFRLDDADTRPVEEIVGGDLGALLGGSEPATVLIAAPGGEQIPAVGDGTLSEPGRYLVLCVIPTGADPVEYLEAAATSDGPPDVDGGPPHVVNGMFAELMVTES